MNYPSPEPLPAERERIRGWVAARSQHPMSWQQRPHLTSPRLYGRSRISLVGLSGESRMVVQRTSATRHGPAAGIDLRKNGSIDFYAEYTVEGFGAEFRCDDD